MKLPNGYGTIYKLPGRRRKPWAVRKTESWFIDENDKLKRKHKYIGYYATKQEALQALAEYNANPYEIQSDITFAEVYNKWSEKKFTEISASNINGYKASYKLCNIIENVRFNDLKLSHLQSVVDSSGKNYPTRKKLKTLFKQLFDYAVQNEIIGRDKHIVEYVNIGKAQKSDKHYRFTDEEIKTMWRWASNEYVQVILILIYSGVRPGELFNVKKTSVNLEEKSIYIEKGKNDNAVRKVPIHDKIFPLVEHWISKPNTEYLITQLDSKKIKFDTNHGQYTETYWKPLLTDMGILQYKNDKGVIKEHTPDDTRHTFTTIWKEKKLDESMRRKIQGHSGKGIGEMVYTHFEFEKLREELNKL